MHCVAAYTYIAGARMFCTDQHLVCWPQAAEQEFVAKVEAALEANDVDEDQLIEERRRRRQEILAKHQQGQAAQPGTFPFML